MTDQHLIEITFRGSVDQAEHLLYSLSTRALLAEKTAHIYDLDIGMTPVLERTSDAGVMG